MRHNFYQFSKCIGSWLHRFEIVEEYSEGVKEVCMICGKTKFFKIIDGKVDNFNYMAYHYRQALPPYHPYYYHEREYNPFNVTSPYEHN
jgi:hypothetical protein